MKYIEIKYIIFAVILSLGMIIYSKGHCATNTYDLLGRPMVIFSDSEAILITGKIHKHKRHKRKSYPVMDKQASARN